MTRLKGKVKSISVTEEQVAEGMQVYYPTHKQWYYVLEVREDGMAVVSSQKIVGLAIQYVFPIISLKTLVVEYKEFSHHSQDLMKVAVYKDKQLPLKYSQWQSAIDNGEVDSDKIVEFERCVKPDLINQASFAYAKIIPQKRDWEIARSVIEKSLGTYTNNMIRNMATNVIETLNKHYPRQ